MGLLVKSLTDVTILEMLPLYKGEDAPTKALPVMSARNVGALVPALGA